MAGKVLMLNLTNDLNIKYKKLEKTIPSNKLSIGYFKLLKYNLQFSSEIYYRKMLNQIDFRKGNSK